MSRCRRRVLGASAGLLLVAALFVPYRTTRVSLSRDPQTNIVWRRTAEGGGYMFLFRYLKRSRERLSNAADRDVRYALRRAEDVNSSRYDLDARLLAFELAAIGLLTGYDLLFLCRGRRKRRGIAGEEAQGDDR